MTDPMMPRARVLSAALCLLLGYGGVAGRPVAALEEGAPVLARQILLPKFTKSDWQGSAFSTDGRFLLVIDDARSFVMDAVDGRELRPVAVDVDEHLIWARSLPGSERWLAATSRGRFVIVDAASGTTTPLLDLAPHLHHRDYREHQITFELLSDTEAVALVETMREEMKPDVRRRYDERTLITFDVNTGTLIGVRDVPADQFTTNLDGFVAVNRDSKLVAVFDPETSSRIAIWQTARPDPNARAALTFACAYDGLSSEQTVALVPHDRGFVAVTKNGSAVYIGPELFGGSMCKSSDRDHDADGDAAAVPAETCRWRVGGDPIAAAATGLHPGELIIARRTLAFERVQLSSLPCRVAIEPLANLQERYANSRLLKALRAVSDASGEVTGGEIAIAALHRRHGYSVIAGGELVWIDGRGGAAKPLINLFTGPTSLDLDAAPGVLIAARYLAPLRVFDLRASALRSIDYDYAGFMEVSWFYNKPFAFARALGAVVVIEPSGRLTFHAALATVDKATLPAPEELSIKRPTGICASDDGSRLLVSVDGEAIESFERSRSTRRLVSTGRIDLGKELDLFKIACDGDAKTAVVADSLSDKVFILGIRRGSLRVLQTLAVAGSSSLLSRPSLSRDATQLAVGGSLFVRSNHLGRYVEAAQFPGVARIVFSDDGRKMLACAAQTALYEAQNVDGGLRVRRLRDDFGSVTDGAFIDDRNVALVRSLEDLDVVSISNEPIGHLVFGEEGTWMFSDSAGRFDVTDLRVPAPASWVMPDDPLRGLPPEIFMRDYYEPQLLARTLECRAAERTKSGACRSEFKQVRPLAALNRVQPHVRFVSIIPEPGRDDEVAVTLDVRGVEATYGSVGTPQTRQSGVYDLRLFRDGQLVGQAPAMGDVTAFVEDTSEEAVRRWRQSRKVIDKIGSRRITFRRVRLPHNGHDGELSAYAFNEDRVKSAIVTAKYRVASSAIRRGRAYLIAIGVSAYENPAWDLHYAHRDAHRLVEVLEPRIRGTDEFDDVISVALTSSWEMRDGVRAVSASTATKHNIKGVFAVLGGAIGAEKLSPLIEGRNRLTRSGPDDLVLILYSSHGYADRNGAFYLFPYDVGRERAGDPTAETLRGAISTADLSRWLRGVDGADIAVIVDACHSAASVQSGAFKPGPMGAAGLGQLAYDKRMRILASSRPADLSWESPQTQQGLLSYALVFDGLLQGKADFRDTDHKIGIEEWLRYGAERVPELYAHYQRGAMASTGARLAIFDAQARISRSIEVGGVDVTARTQQPALFDYSRAPDRLLVVQ